ncbi:MAG: sugar ABC transporter permease, partial [Aggregatilineales bacterium]
MGSRLLHTRFRFIPREQAMAAQRPYTRREQLLTIVLFILPGAVIYTLFLIVPIVQAGYYSLYNWNGLGPLTDFVGFDNYTRAFQHNIFQNSIMNTLTIMVLSLVVQLPLALILAIMVGRKLPGRFLFRSIFFLPYVFSEIITAIIWTFVYNPGSVQQ